MRFAMLLLTCAMLAACGKSGALYMPEKRSTEVPAATSDANEQEPANKARKPEQPPVKP